MIGEDGHLPKKRAEGIAANATTKSKRIQGKIKAYAEDPESQRNNVKALKGSEYIRLPVVVFTNNTPINYQEAV